MLILIVGLAYGLPVAIEGWDNALPRGSLLCISRNTGPGTVTMPPLSLSIDPPQQHHSAAHTAAKILMTIELSKHTHEQAVASLQRYFEKHMDEPIGNVTAGGLLGFFLAEVGPSIYNQAVADTQERIQARVAEIDMEVHEEEFSYWQKSGKKR